METTRSVSTVMLTRSIHPLRRAAPRTEHEPHEVETATMQRRKAAMTAAVAGLVLTGSLAVGVAPSYADSSSSSAVVAAKAPKTDGAKMLCRRVPRLERRIDRAIRRLDAGVGTRGSIARLQQRVDNAKTENHAAIAKLLGDRLTYRKGLLPSLTQRQGDLKSVATWCQDNNGGATASSTTSAS
jgi:hypothetical protein